MQWLLQILILQISSRYKSDGSCPVQPCSSDAGGETPSSRAVWIRTIQKHDPKQLVLEGEKQHNGFSALPFAGHLNVSLQECRNNQQLGGRSVTYIYFKKQHFQDEVEHKHNIVSVSAQGHNVPPPAHVHTESCRKSRHIPTLSFCWEKKPEEEEEEANRNWFYVEFVLLVATVKEGYKERDKGEEVKSKWRNRAIIPDQ